MPKKSVKPRTYQRLKGFRDILPADQLYWDRVIDVIRQTAGNYRYGRIIVPVLEERGLFERSVGIETDIVSKEMYSFLDPGERLVALRPEFTAGMVRAFTEHAMMNLPQPVRLYDMGPVFRHDNPQAGRYRQFWQFDFETYGDTDPVIDAQMIRMTQGIFEQLGISVVVHVNSIGCRTCRPGYMNALVQSVRGSRSKLCEDCQRRMARNPLRLLDCKNEQCQAVLASAPSLIDWLCEECKQHFMTVLEHLDDFEVSYELNPRLVRGLDYYSRTTFEVFASGGLAGTQSSLAGGGRYDYLIEDLGGRPTPAIGFAGGMDRIVELMKEMKVEVRDPYKPEVFVAQLGTEARKAAYRLYDDVARAGIKVAESFSKSGLKGQLDQANRLAVLFTLILGQKELADKTVIIRDMENGIQEIVDSQKVVTELQKRLKAKKGANDFHVTQHGVVGG